MALTVKNEFKDTIIGFNHSCKPLGERDDLHILYEIAKANNRQDYLNMFEDDSVETDEDKVKRFNEKQGNKHNRK
ncbi:MAG: hypothetical protein LC112_14035 [Flavobacteriales bacterium]|nr:hypothetical protein [Flavobacteriales bacterium]